MKVNYQQKLENILKEISCNAPKRLLLHSCCGPCSTYVLNFLKKYFDITVFFYNPNILPKEEYLRRLDAQKKVISALSDQRPIALVVPPYKQNEFLEIAKGYENEPERGNRCVRCIDLRIEATAKFAAENDFDYFCTTLSVSPHKDAALLNELSEKYSKKYKIQTLPADFKKKNGYLESIRLSKELAIYRQNYCGCLYAKNEGDD